jgi:hypothetical protein
MKKLYGIITTKEGEYIVAIAEKESGKYHFVKSAKWDMHNTYKNILLLGKPVKLGLECHWARKPVPDFNRSLRTYTHTGSIPRVQSIYYEASTKPLEQNLIGVYPSDAYLCTLPLNCMSGQTESYISIAKEENCFKVGVTIDRQLHSVYSVPLSEELNMESFLARLERFWVQMYKDDKLPSKMYSINCCFVFEDSKYHPEELKILGIDNLQTLKAFGIALCTDSSIPAFSGASKGSELRRVRSITYFISTALIVISLVIFSIETGLSLWYGSQMRKYEKNYSELLTGNKELRGLLVVGSALSKKLDRLESYSVNRTQWSRFLHELGILRPHGVYFEKLGCDSEDSGGRIHVALTGWAESEQVVTLMIKKLNESEIISDVKLSSIEKNEKQKENCRFKILCSLILLKK